MPVPQHVLNWLYSVLTSEYHDVNRTYHDVAHVLTRYPSLAPRTDVHTFPNGSSALLLQLSGTLPVTFRGSPYRFPVSIWIPYAYPREPPIIYVTPTETMKIRPGQHVDPQGQVYQPYLAEWRDHWEKSTLHDFLAILSDAFAKDPPVVSRQQDEAIKQSSSVLPLEGSLLSPPLPPLPLPPPPPDASKFVHGQGPQRPPRPPLKSPQHDARGRPVSPLSQNPEHCQSSLQRLKPSRYDFAPPLPAHIESSGSIPSHPTRTSLQGSHHAPIPQGPQSAIPIWTLERSGLQYDESRYKMSQDRSVPNYYVNDPRQATGRAGHYSSFAQLKVSHFSQADQTPPQPTSNLLDEPLAIDIASPEAVEAPAIPPNPEKDMLFHQLAQVLASMRRQSYQQDESSLTGLQAQRIAMLSVLPALQSEIAQLTQLSCILQSNSDIVHDALHKADDVIEAWTNHPAPDVDELLVAPTVVSNQLYTLVAEERALGDAIFMLGKSVEKGRIPPAVFAKLTRSLAREWFFKKALVHKIAIGLGLVHQ